MVTRKKLQIRRRQRRKRQQLNLQKRRRNKKQQLRLRNEKCVLIDKV